MRTPSKNTTNSPNDAVSRPAASPEFASPSQFDVDLELPTFEMGEDFYNLTKHTSPYKSPVQRSAASALVASLASSATTTTTAAAFAPDQDETARPGSRLTTRSPSVPSVLSRAAESSTSINSLASSSGGRSYLNRSAGTSSSEKEGALKSLRSGWSKSKEVLSSSLKKSSSQTSRDENTSPEVSSRLALSFGPSADIAWRRISLLCLQSLKRCLPPERRFLGWVQMNGLHLYLTSPRRPGACSAKARASLDLRTD